MAQTYLNIVNQVLTRLRESTVTTNAQTAYSTMVGAFVNDAKRECEDTWQWSHLLDNYQFVTVPGTYSYEINGMTTRSGRTLSDRCRLWIETYRNIPLLINVTPNFEKYLAYKPTLLGAVSNQVTINQNVLNVPQYWQIVQSATNDVPGLWNKTVLLFDIPNAAYSLQGWVCNPQNDLVQDSDVLLIPEAAVIQKAYLYCIYERGEELGETITLTQQKVEDTLAAAVELDQALNSEFQNVGIPFGGQY